MIDTKESSDCIQNVENRVKKVLELQIEFVRSVMRKKYSSVDEIERLVIKPLNNISLTMGFKGLFELKDFKGMKNTQKFIAVSCPGCTKSHNNKLFLIKISGTSSQFEVFKFHTGTAVHTNIKSHLIHMQ